jgi:hypothetical protein
MSVPSVGGVYNATAPTIQDRGREEFQLDASGNQKTTLATKLAGEDLTNDVMKVEHQMRYATIATATTTTVKTGAGVLHNIIVTGGTTGTIVIYDNTAASGTKIADFDTTNLLATYPFHCKFSTGLTIVTSAATKITVNYR